MASLNEFKSKTRYVLMREKTIGDAIFLQGCRSIGVLIGDGLAAFNPALNGKNENRWIVDLFRGSFEGWDQVIYAYEPGPGRSIRPISDKQAVEKIVDEIVRLCGGYRTGDPRLDHAAEKLALRHFDFIMQRYEVFDKMFDLCVSLRAIRDLTRLPPSGSPEGKALLALAEKLQTNVLLNDNPKALGLETINYINQTLQSGGNMVSAIDSLDRYIAYLKPFVEAAKKDALR